MTSDYHYCFPIDFHDDEFDNYQKTSEVSDTDVVLSIPQTGQSVEHCYGINHMVVQWQKLR